jgi:hypothetical protein
MATLTVQKMVLTGVAPTFVSVASSDVFPNDGKTYIEVKNAGGTQDVVTIPAQSTCSQGTLHDSVTTVPITTGDRVIGPFDPTRFNNSSGQVTVNHSFTTSVTCAVVSESP